MTRQLTERLHLDKLPEGFRNALDSWRFWFTMGAIAIGCLFIWGAVNTLEIANTQSKQARDEAVKAAQIQASAQAAFSSCVNSRPELQKLSTFVHGVNLLAFVLIHDSRATLQVTAKGTPEYAARVGNLARLSHAAMKVGAIKALPVPTLADCQDRKASVLTEAHH